jgi:hypothetical protein
MFQRSSLHHSLVLRLGAHIRPPAMRERVRQDLYKVHVDPQQAGSST